jgi:NADPH:quinone reductase
VALLRPGGRHLVFGWSSEGLADGGDPILGKERFAELGVTSESVLGPAMLRRTGGDDPLRTLELRALAQAASGALVPTVQSYPLAEAAQAHRDLESRATVGKVILAP